MVSLALPEYGYIYGYIGLFGPHALTVLKSSPGGRAFRHKRTFTLLDIRHQKVVTNKWKKTRSDLEETYLLFAALKHTKVVVSSCVLGANHRQAELSLFPCQPSPTATREAFALR